MHSCARSITWSHVWSMEKQFLKSQTGRWMSMEKRCAQHSRGAGQEQQLDAILILQVSGGSDIFLSVTGSHLWHLHPCFKPLFDAHNQDCAQVSFSASPFVEPLVSSMPRNVAQKPLSSSSCSSTASSCCLSHPPPHSCTCLQGVSTYHEDPQECVYSAAQVAAFWTEVAQSSQPASILG